MLEILCISAVCMVYVSRKLFVFAWKTKSFLGENKKFLPNRTAENKKFSDFQDLKNTFLRLPCIVMYSWIHHYTLSNVQWNRRLDAEMYRCIVKRKIFFRKIKYRFFWGRKFLNRLRIRALRFLSKCSKKSQLAFFILRILTYVIHRS